ncbi:MAG TPA: hypothetical protein VEY71_09150 [Chitinophagales bacterium]|nr:hypothetical protein [Chitinophagales bacterium]
MMKEVYFRAMLTGDDLALGPVYFFLFMLTAFFLRNFAMKHDNPARKYYVIGLAVKLVGAAMVGVIYQFYYDGGDTTQYYNNARVIYNAFNDSPFYFYRLMLTGPNFSDPAVASYGYWMYFHQDHAGWFFGKICGLLSIFSFGTYVPIAMCLAFISFLGAWSLFITFCKIYPSMHKQFAIAVLFIPSVVFWGSGVLKDSMTFASVGFMTSAVYNLFFERRRVFFNSLLFFAAAYVGFKLKAYIVYSMLPALVFWVFLHIRSQVSTGALRTMLGPVAILCAAIFGFLLVRQLGASFTESVERAQVFQDYHTLLAEKNNASGYSLGATDGSFLSILSKIPAAANVTLFRPYLWETRNPVMLLSALESTLMMLFTLVIFWRTGFTNTFRSLARNPTAFFCMFFAIFFAFAVGFTAYNFGALVRYKIPCIPFFVAGLYILKMQKVEDKAARLELKKHKTPRFVTS